MLKALLLLAFLATINAIPYTEYLRSRPINENYYGKETSMAPSESDIQKRESPYSLLRKKPQNRRGYLNSLVAGGSFGRAARNTKEVVPYEIASRNMRSLNSLTAGGAFGKRSHPEIITTKQELMDYVLKKHLKELQMKNLIESMNDGRLNAYVLRLPQDYYPRDVTQKNDSLWALIKLGNLSTIKNQNGNPEETSKQTDEQHQKAFSKNDAAVSYQDANDAYHLSEYYAGTFPTSPQI